MTTNQMTALSYSYLFHSSLSIIIVTCVGCINDILVVSNLELNTHILVTK